MRFQAANDFLLHLKKIRSDCSDIEEKEILNRAVFAWHHKMSSMLKFDAIFNDNDKIQLLSELREFQTSNNGKRSIFNKGLSAEPSTKNGTNFAAKVGFAAVANQKNGNCEILNVGFSAVPIRKNGNFENLSVGFSAVPNQNNGKSSIFDKGLSAVPSQKNGTNFLEKVGLSAVANQKNGDLDILHVSFSAVPNQDTGNGIILMKGLADVPVNENTGNNFIFKKRLAAALILKNCPSFVNHASYAAKPTIFSFFSDKNLKIQFFVRFDNFVSRTFSNGYTTLGGRGHRFILTLETRFPRIKTYKLKYRLCFTFKSTSTFLYF